LSKQDEKKGMRSKRGKKRVLMGVGERTERVHPLRELGVEPSVKGTEMTSKKEHTETGRKKGREGLMTRD